jgi:hypothetical protein
MVAFVDHEMPIITDDIVDFSPANQALDQGDINLTFGLRRRPPIMPIASPGIGDITGSFQFLFESSLTFAEERY